MSKKYITTAIAYVNGSPHIGHALEFVQADAYARFWRMMGDEVFLLTGTDEHGVKIYEKALESGLDLNTFVDQNAEKFQELDKLLKIDYDDFIRTTEERHKIGAKKVWEKLLAKEDIYKGTYEGKYCVGCEMYVTEKDLDDGGNCLHHQKPPIILKEENYFFRLTKYSAQIKKLLEDDIVKISPESRKKEFLNMIGEEGLPDVSFSRPKKSLPWGVEVPNDPEHVMYVWCDALSNYITAIDYQNEGELFKKYWPADAQIVGKDILRFHAGTWIGMLLSLELELPKNLFVHGFITSGGRKMGKSLGNVVDPIAIIEEFGVEPVRYFLLKEIPTLDDGDFTRERFIEIYNSELANGVGNFVNRVLMMAEKYSEGKVPKIFEDTEVSVQILKFVEQYKGNFEAYDIKAALENVYQLLDFGNKYIDDKKPWVLAKEESLELSGVLYLLLEMIGVLGTLLKPIMPDTAEKILNSVLDENQQSKFEYKSGYLKEGQILKRPEVLFPRLES